MDHRILLSGILAFLLLVPAVSVAMEPTEADIGTDCIRAAEHPDNPWPTIRAQVSLLENTTDTIRIDYYGDDIPPEFFVDIPKKVNLTDSRGFVYRRGEYWYNGKERPYLEFRLDGEDSYRFSANARDWTFSPLPSHYNANVNFNTSSAGVVGDHFILLGNYSAYSTTLGCHKIRLIVSGSSLSDSESVNVLNALRYSAENLDVGHRYEEVRIFAIPGRPDPSAGGRTAQNEAWISTQPFVNMNTSSVAIHEYVHTRQAFDASGIAPRGRGMLWFTEGSATYYQYQFSHELGIMNGKEYNSRLRNGSTFRAALGNRSSWTERRTEYKRGFAYVAILDQKLRDATGSKYTVEDLIREINNKPSRPVDVNRNPFVERIRNNSDDQVANWANRSINSAEPFNYSGAMVPEQTTEPSVWDNAVTRFDDRVRADPFGSMLVAFSIGLLLGFVVLDNLSPPPEED